MPGPWGEGFPGEARKEARQKDHRLGSRPGSRKWSEPHVLVPSVPPSTVPPYSPGGPGPATQGVNMANSIASLRLKAKEFSLHHSQVPTVN